MLLLSPAPLQQAQKYSTTLRNRLEARTPLPSSIANERQACTSALLKHWQKHHFHPLSFAPWLFPSTCCDCGSPHWRQSWPAVTELANRELLQTEAFLMLLKHQQTRAEVLQGQGTWASDLHISRAKCLLVLLAASGSLQTIYLHLRNSYLVQQTHQQFTLTQKSGLLSSEETMKNHPFLTFLPNAC